MKRTSAQSARLLPQFLLSAVFPAMVWTLACTVNARAETAFSLAPVASGVLAISGAGLKKIAALDFTVVYDTGTARNPQVLRGPFVPADASFFSNTAIPGELRVMIIRNEEIAGSGTLATISFEKVGTDEPRIVAFKSNPISVKASPLDNTAGVTDKPTPETPPAGTDDTTGSTAGISSAGGATGTAGGVAGVVAIGTITMLGDTVTMAGDRSEEKKAQDKKDGPLPDSLAAEQQPLRQADPSPEPPAARPEQSVPTPAPSSKTIVYKSVMERMKEYKGERTPAALTALFQPAAGQKVHQEPPVVVSNGKNAVVIRVDLPLALKASPNFSFRNANMVSLEQADDGSWVIRLIPRKDALDAGVTVSFDGSEIRYPLAVAPAIDPALLMLKGSPESTFSYFLKQQGAGREARFDLNGDGRYDYLDDYLFTAHYLAAEQKTKRRTAANKQAQGTP